MESSQQTKSVPLVRKSHYRLRSMFSPLLYYCRQEHRAVKCVLQVNAKPGSQEAVRCGKIKGLGTQLVLKYHLVSGFH